MRVLTSDVSTLPNRLLGTLSQADWNDLRTDARRAYVTRGQSLLTCGDPVEHVYFVESGLVSLLGGGAGRGVQVAMVGSEGLVGVSALLGQTVACTDAVVQFPGSVLFLPLNALVHRVKAMPRFLGTCMEYLLGFVAQVIETAGSAAQDSVLQRCVRWLLAADDRMGGEDLPVTHEMLAVLLGVRRPGVTLAMAVLDGEGLVQMRRGSVRVLDRAGLANLAAHGSAVRRAA